MRNEGIARLERVRLLRNSRPGVGVPNSVARRCGKSGGSGSAGVPGILSTRITLTLPPGPPGSGGSPSSVSATSGRNARIWRSGPLIVKLNDAGSTSLPLSVRSPAPRATVTLSAKLNGASGWKVKVLKSSERRSCPSWVPDMEPWTSTRPATTEAGSRVPPGRMMTFVPGRIRLEPGMGDRNSSPGGIAADEAAAERETGVEIAATRAITNTPVLRDIICWLTRGPEGPHLATTFATVLEGFRRSPGPASDPLPHPACYQSRTRRSGGM